MSYKYCFARSKCFNTSFNSPLKTFIHVPTDPTIRKKWCEAAGCPEKKLRPSSYCCEDHFDLENDLQNYRYWKQFGGRKLIKSHVVPRFSKKISIGETSTCSSTSNTPVVSLYVQTNSDLEIKLEQNECNNLSDSSDNRDFNVHSPSVYSYTEPLKNDVCFQVNMEQKNIVTHDQAVQCSLIKDSFIKYDKDIKYPLDNISTSSGDTIISQEDIDKSLKDSDTSVLDSLHYEIKLELIKEEIEDTTESFIRDNSEEDIDTSFKNLDTSVTDFSHTNDIKLELIKEENLDITESFMRNNSQEDSLTSFKDSGTSFTDSLQSNELKIGVIKEEIQDNITESFKKDNQLLRKALIK